MFTADNKCSGLRPRFTITGGSGVGASGTENQATTTFPVTPGSADYVQLLTAGSGYTTGAGAPTVSISGTAVTGLTASVSSLAISGTNNTIGGAGNLIINAQITGPASGAATVVGTGTVTLTSNELFTGTLNVSSGVLVNNGTMAGIANVTGGVLAGTGVINGSVSVTSGAIAPGVNTSSHFGGVGTLTLNNGLRPSALERPSTFDLGPTQDLINVGGQLTPWQRDRPELPADRRSHREFALHLDQLIRAR